MEPQIEQNIKSSELKSTKRTKAELEIQKSIDSHSIYISPISSDTTPDQIEAFYNASGPINRVTILYNHYTGKPKGYAYVEYQDSKGSERAIIELNEREFNGQIVKVQAKRTNLPGFTRFKEKTKQNKQKTKQNHNNL